MHPWIQDFQKLMATGFQDAKVTNQIQSQANRSGSFVQQGSAPIAMLQHFTMMLQIIYRMLHFAGEAELGCWIYLQELLVIT